MEVIAREVEFAPGEAPQIYHAVGQLDYLAILARTPDGRIPLVRQYRPALEAFTWELPAGLVENGEDPARPARASCWRKPAIRRAPCIARRTGRGLHRAGSATASIRFSSRPANASRISRRSPASTSR